MRKTQRLLLAAALVSGLSLNAFARGAGAGGGDHHAVGPASGSHALDNSNGRFAPDRDKGIDRAEDRRSPKARTPEGTGGMRERRSDAARTAIPPHRTQRQRSERATHADNIARERTYLM